MVSYYMVCRDCKHRFELAGIGNLRADNAKTCPRCGSLRVRQRLSGVLRNLDVAAHDGEKLRPKKCA